MTYIAPRIMVVNHNGKQYSGHVAEIHSTRLGNTSDRGIFDFSLGLRWSGSGVNFGGYVMDEPFKDDAGKHAGRRGTAWGMQLLMDVMATVGVDCWEQVQGKKIIVLFDYQKDGITWGGFCKGIASLMDEDKVLVISEHLDKFRRDNGLDTDEETD